MTTLELVSDLSLVNGVPVVPSTVVAERFGKQHNNVLRAIRAMIKDLPDEFTQLNFEQCFKINDLANGKREPYFTLTRDAFSLLVMGFTGPEATRWKLNFITAFNGLERLARESAQREREDRLRIEASKEARQEALADALALTPMQYKVAKSILRYRTMGLERWEIMKLLGVSKDTVSRTLRKMGISLDAPRRSSQRVLPINMPQRNA